MSAFQWTILQKKRTLAASRRVTLLCVSFTCNYWNYFRLGLWVRSCCTKTSKQKTIYNYKEQLCLWSNIEFIYLFSLARWVNIPLVPYNKYVKETYKDYQNALSSLVLGNLGLQFAKTFWETTKWNTFSHPMI